MSDSELEVLDFGGDEPTDPTPDPNEKWPVKDNTYVLILDVEHIGPRYEDTPDRVALVGSDPEVVTYLNYCGVSVDECIDEDSLPIASGTYKLLVQFYVWGGYDGWTGDYDFEDGFIVLSLEKLQ